MTLYSCKSIGSNPLDVSMKASSSVSSQCWTSFWEFQLRVIHSSTKAGFRLIVFTVVALIKITWNWDKPRAMRTISIRIVVSEMFQERWIRSGSEMNKEFWSLVFSIICKIVLLLSTISSAVIFQMTLEEFGR